MFILLQTFRHEKNWTLLTKDLQFIELKLNKFNLQITSCHLLVQITNQAETNVDINRAVHEIQEVLLDKMDAWNVFVLLIVRIGFTFFLYSFWLFVRTELFFYKTLHWKCFVLLRLIYRCHSDFFLLWNVL